MGQATFISKGNICYGCPLKDAPLKKKVLNLCHRGRPNFKVKYLLDDFGHTVCEVKSRRIELSNF
jgi:hypothetical protein